MNEEKDRILICKMCTGNYNDNHLGHEIINFFEPSFVPSTVEKGYVYFYINPYGDFAKVHDKKVQTILLTSPLSDGRIEIMAKIENPVQIYEFPTKEEFEAFKKNDKKYEYNSNGLYAYNSKKQKEIYGGIKYFDKTISDIYAKEHEMINSESEEKAEFPVVFTYKAKKSDVKKTLKRCFISCNDDDKDGVTILGDETRIIKIHRKIASSSLKQFIIKNQKNEKGDEKTEKDFETITAAMEDMEWEDGFISCAEKEEDLAIKDYSENFLQLIGKTNEEQIYTNMLTYWLSKDNAFKDFLGSIDGCVKEAIKKEEFVVESEKFIYKDSKSKKKKDNNTEKKSPVGRIDIFAQSKDFVVIIENKIESDIKDCKANETKTQLSAYYKAIEDLYPEKKRKYYLIVPDYRKIELEKQLNRKDPDMESVYTRVTYQELYNFFKNYTPDPNDQYIAYYKDLMSALYLQSSKNRSEKNKIEMKSKLKRILKNL